MNYRNRTGAAAKVLMGPGCIVDSQIFEEEGKKICQIICSTFNVLSAIPATVVNFLVILSIWRTPSLHSPSNVLLLSLALSDLCVGLFAQPLFQVLLVAFIRRAVHLFCVSELASNMCGYVMCGASISILAAISIDRCTAIYYHLRYREIVTVKRVIASIAFLWLCSLVISASNILWLGYNFTENYSSAFICLCFAIIGFNYLMIYRVARRHRKQLRSHSWAQARPQGSRNMAKLTKSSWSMFLINFAFILCFIPFFVSRLVIQFTGNNSSKECVAELALVLVFTNSTLNPILYCWRFRGIRAAIMRTTKTLFRKASVTPQQESVN